MPGRPRSFCAKNKNPDHNINHLLKLFSEKEAIIMFRLLNKVICSFGAKNAALIFALFILSGCGGPKQTVETAPPEPEPTVATEPETPPADIQPKEEAKPVETENAVPLVLQNVYFEFDKYDLTSEALQTLADNARALKAHPEARVLIEGHCDERGTIEYNLALGDKRAKAARDYLISLGVNSAQISTISYGKEQPLDPRSNEEAWARNRRAEFERK
jgi:peptidoglycan-associated lipoprotein